VDTFVAGTAVFAAANRDYAGAGAELRRLAAAGLAKASASGA
jgi:hypothetical protein